MALSSDGVIQAKSPGIATVKATSTCDPQIYDEVMIQINQILCIIVMNNVVIDNYCYISCVDCCQSIRK